MRYAAKLLFQYRVATRGRSPRYRTVEERIVVINATSAREALAKATREGRTSESDFVNTDGDDVFIEFIGVTDLMHLGAEAEKNTVWYEIRSMASPMERKKELVPRPLDLSAMKLESESSRRTRRSPSKMRRQTGKRIRG